MSKVAIVIRHLAFEHLGCFEKTLIEHDYKIYYYDAGVHDIWTIDPLNPDLLIILGGPIGAYDCEQYPFLKDELRILKIRMDENRPTLGICLGAQLMAVALGADIKPGQAKEIGYKPLELSPAGFNSPLKHLKDQPVLHWHQDTFSLPDGAENLAHTDICAQQAFQKGKNILGLQFHPEISAGSAIEAWLIGHAFELAYENIELNKIRNDAEMHGHNLEKAAGKMLSQWISELVAA